MANNYSHSAERFRFPAEAARDVQKFLNFDFENQENIESLPHWFLERYDIDPTDSEWLFDFAEENELFYLAGIESYYDESDGTLYIAHNDSSISPVAWVLAEVMEHYVIEDPVLLREVYTCDRLRPNEFGATAYVVGLNNEGKGSIGTLSLDALGKAMVETMRQQREASTQSPK